MKKRVSVLLLVVLAAVVSFAAAACNKKTKQNGNGPVFLEGAITEVTVGQEVRISEFVDFGAETNYSFTITDPKGDAKDFTSRVVWTPEDIGAHKLTYTINSGKNKGTAEMTVTVKAYAMEWSYNNAQSLMYQMGSTLAFSDLFEAMNVTVQSFCPYTLKMVSVLVDNVTTEFTNETEYTFASLSDHCFRFKVETEDGQQDVATVIVQVKYMDAASEHWMHENNITEHGYKRLTDAGNVLLDAGTFSGRANSVTVTDLPYMAFNGQYGVGNYVTVDFTGDNLPCVAFFADQVTADLVDGHNGIYIANVMGSTMGTEKTRLTVYGPQKIKGGVFGGSDRLLVETDSALGSAKLSPTAHYRYIAGVTEVSEKTYNAGGDDEQTGLGATLKLLLVNLDTGEYVYDREQELVTMARYNLTSDYFAGNIVLYGGFDRQIAWDKVHLIRQATNKDDIYNWVRTASFAPYAASVVPVSTTLQKSDYIAPDANADYKLWYTDASGVRTDIQKNATAFSFPAVGEYRLYYTSGEEDVLPVSMVVSVTNMSADTWSYLQTNKMRLYKSTVDISDGSAELQAGSFTGKANSVGNTDLAYISLDGDFGVHSYATVDFTGSALPQIAFFVKNATANLVDGKDGTILVNGIAASGSDTSSNGYRVYGPEKIKGAQFGAWGEYALAGNNTSPIGASNLSSTTHYRYIAGVSEVSDKTFEGHTGKGATLRLLLIDLDTGEYVFNESIPLPKSAIHALEGDYFTGSIVLYGRLGQAIAWDKVYPVRTGINDIYSLVEKASFKTTSKTVVKAGESLRVADYIEDNATAVWTANATGEKIANVTDTFSFAQAGKYRLCYKPADTRKITSYLEINVLSATTALKNVAALYGATLAENDGVTFAAGSYSGADSSHLDAADVPYMAFSKAGDYKLKETGTNYTGLSVVVDFKGANMPNIAFLAGELSDSAKNFVGAQGILFSPGILQKNGEITSNSLNNRFNLYGPKMFYGKDSNGAVDNSGWGVLTTTGSQSGTYAFGYKYMLEHPDARFRLIVSVDVPDTSVNVFSFMVTLLQEKVGADAESSPYELLFKSGKVQIKEVNLTDDGKTMFKDTGNIIIYGAPYREITIDKIQHVGMTVQEINNAYKEWTGETSNIWYGTYYKAETNG